EGWDNFSVCQHLATQARLVRVAALKSCLNGDLQRYLIQRTIEIKSDADGEGIIMVISKYIWAQHPACSACKTREDDLMRDRIVFGILSNGTRHKLLSEAEEGAVSSQNNLEPKNVQGISSYKTGKSFIKNCNKQAKKCSNCGRRAHELKDVCPAIGRTCHKCGSHGHFSPCCPNKDAWSAMLWIPNTGSDVDAIDIKTLALPGENLSNLKDDPVGVRNVFGGNMRSMGYCSVSIRDKNAVVCSRLHVFKDIQGAYLSRGTLKAMEYLPPHWPKTKVFANIRDMGPEINKDTSKAKLIAEYPTVFNEDKLIPIARKIAFGHERQIKSQLDKMVTDAIIEPVSEPSE
ncbi:hypothetical protein TCAL_11583, partial [Tigriopus californicus]